MGTRGIPPSRRWPLLAVLGLLAASCVGPHPGTGTSPTISAAAQSVALEPGVRAGQVPAPTLGPQGPPDARLGGVEFSTVNGVLDNSPIFDGDFADPAAIEVDDSVYSYASDTTTAHIPVIVSGRATGYSGSYLGDALPTLPPWTFPGLQWGPAVWARPDGTYVLYYSTPDSAPSTSCIAAAAARHVSTVSCDLEWNQTDRQCISAATSANPAGPFVDDSSAPFVCPVAEGGAIDPSIFVTTAGTPYLLWKSDGNGYGLPTVIYSQQLAPDGLSTAGPPHRMIGATQPWEGDLVEGPAMVEDAGTYWLFYSANNWDSEDYAIGVARCASVIGPCTKPFDHPWMASAGDDQGPGGPEFFDAFGLVWMVHHGWLPGQAGTPDGQRRLYLDLVTFPHGIPQVAPAALAAALAELGDAYLDDDTPLGVASSFLAVVHGPGGALSSSGAATVSGYGAQVCAQLERRTSAWTVVSDLQHRHLSQFESYVVVGAAAEYLCPSHREGVLGQLKAGLNPS